MTVDTSRDWDWRRTLGHYLSELATDWHRQPELGDAAIVVHGSVTTGDADEYSDIDIQVVCPDDQYSVARERAVADGHLAANERPVIFRSPRTTTDGRRPLCAAELRPLSDVAEALRTDLLVELWTMQNAWVVTDPEERVGQLVAAARTEFVDQLEHLTAGEMGHAARRQIWLAIAAQRADAAGAGLLAASFIRAILRVACMLDDSPAPPDKWLHRWASSRTTLGTKVAAACLHLLSGDVPLEDLDTTSADVLETACTVAAARWPGARWADAPVNYGIIRC